MANNILLITTIINILLYLYLAKNDSKYKNLYYFGFLTSLLNHFFSNKAFVYLDRLVMIIIFITNVIMINNNDYNADKRYLLYLIYFIMILFYIQSKIIKNNEKRNLIEFSFFHGIVHFLATLSLVLI